MRWHFTVPCKCTSFLIYKHVKFAAKFVHTKRSTDFACFPLLQHPFQKTLIQNLIALFLSETKIYSRSQDCFHKVSSGPLNFEAFPMSVVPKWLIELWILHCYLGPGFAKNCLRYLNISKAMYRAGQNRSVHRSNRGGKFSSQCCRQRKNVWWKSEMTWFTRSPHLMFRDLCPQFNVEKQKVAFPMPLPVAQD